ncbi:hypothetical protein [Streptomyces sp. 3N207]|uniref:hypothetical protein n=1 Tax=Streptomyces sp. 3N207 TaxID=3457417 RepID=UPI003FD55CD3
MSSRRGLYARLNYLTRSAAGGQAMADAGIAVTRGTLHRWLQHKQTPRQPRPY